ncbi:MAG: sulfatase-like hydrolase/transferase [Acidobacteriota bacterium]
MAWVLLATGLTLKGKDNLLIVSVDTLRADHLSCYGYKLNRTPNIDRWAAEGVRFERAYAEVPLTLPSHSTLFTGTLPFYHGVRDNAGFRLPADRTTLAEVLRDRGYETAAFVSAYVLASRFGLAQGFTTYNEPLEPRQKAFQATSSLRRTADETTGEFLNWLENRAKKPFFVWVHFYDPHGPYPSGYDHEVSRVDRNIGAIDGALRARNLLPTTHVFFLSDHGESLGEHGESGHGFFVYDSTLRVPWIVRPARSFTPRTKRVSQEFSLLDVLPTALRLLGFSAPPEAQGRSAVGPMLARPVQPRALYAECYLPQLQFGWSPLRSIRLGRHKFIEAPQPELFDLSADPLEQDNLFPREQALGLRLQDQLKEYVGRYSGKDPGNASLKVDSESAQRLAALGYVAMASPGSPRDTTGGADPKDRIQLFEQYQKVLAMLHRKPERRVFEMIADLRRRDPRIQGLFFLEGLANERSGRLDQAGQSYLRAVEENPENTLVLANLGRIYIQLRQPEKAEQAFRAVLSRDPEDYRVRNNLGMLLRLKGRDAESMSEFQSVVEGAPAYVPGWINLGIGLARKQAFEEAEKALRRALELDGESAAAHFHLGRLLHSQGRIEEAQRELETASRLDPRFRK